MTWEKEEKTMKHRIKILLLAVLIAALCNCMLMIGMTKKKENNTIPKDASLICEETVSPNKDYITDEKDLVNYTVRVYQEKNNDIIVYAESNSPLFDEAQYIVTCDHAITADGTPNTAHSLNPVPFIYITENKNAKVKDGILADVAPSILHIMGLPQPEEMTGNNLIED